MLVAEIWFVENACHDRTPWERSNHTIYCGFVKGNIALSWAAKIAINDLDPLERDIELMAEAVVQVYKTFCDYRNDMYPQLHFQENRKIYPVVTTLENWHLFGPAMTDILQRSISKKMEAHGVSLELLKEMPYSIWHISELERGAQIINKTGIHDFIEGKINDPEMKTWAWHTYMTQAFPGVKTQRNLFAGEYDAIFEQLRP